MRALIFIDPTQPPDSAVPQVREVQRLGSEAMKAGALSICNVATGRCVVMREIEGEVRLSSSVNTARQRRVALSDMGYEVETYDVRDLVRFLEQYDVPF